MAHIEPGEFWMGRTHMWLIDELGMHLRLRLDDQPAHLTEMDGFFIDTHEVTNEAYAVFVAETGHRAPFHWIEGQLPEGQERFPVYNVSWEDAVVYCGFVGKRLPTEAEWERAARGGRDRTMYPWGDELRPETEEGATTLARFGLPNGPTEVGSFPRNGFSLYDVTGNVWEWVDDWYDRHYYSVSPFENPKGPESGSYRVMRGGGWSDGDYRLLALHYRNFTAPDLRSNTIGFRCAQSARQ